MKAQSVVFAVILLVACQQNEKSGKRKQQLVEKPAIVFDTITKAAESETSDDTIISTTWYYKNLSPDFNFRIYLEERSSLCASSSKKFEIAITDKNDSLLQKITVPRYEGMQVYMKDYPSHARSYETGVGTKNKAIDEYYGHFLLQDFNLDSLYDFAVIRNIPMSGTPSYTFYLQNESGKFEENRYLTEEVKFFPEIRQKTRTLIAQSHSGCCMFYWDYFTVDTFGNFRKVKSVEKDASKD